MMVPLITLLIFAINIEVEIAELKLLINQIVEYLTVEIVELRLVPENT